MSEAKTWQIATLVDIKILAQSYYLLSVRLPNQLQYQPGQHVTLRFEDELGEMICHYSIASAPHLDHISEFCVAFDVGSRTQKVFSRLKPGDELQLAGPFGEFVLPERLEGPLVFAAGGSGISPLRAMIQLLHAESYAFPIQLLFGCQKFDSFPFAPEFKALAQKNGLFKVAFAAEEGELGDILQGRVTDLLKRHVNPGAHYFICGPFGMVEAARKFLKEKGVKGAQIHFERY